MIQALFDGRTVGPNSTNHGGYDNPATNRLMDAALSTVSAEASEAAWHEAATQIMEDAAIVPLTESKIPVYHSRRLQNCNFSNQSFNCDVTAVWLQGASAGASQP
jgi:peptide/nickel transport system substrate-binding protein